MFLLATTVMESLSDVINAIYPVALKISLVLAGIVTAFSLVNHPYMVIGLFLTRKFKPAKNNHKYAIVIPARNEEGVIANLIKSIHKQDYPQELITIFVIADNCTDNTAKVARENGAICYERFNDQEKTKGFALKFLFERIQEDYGTDAFEGYFVFDADNLLKKDYITRMNEAFDEGEKIITSYRATKNWNESWIASTYALHWIRSIRYKHRARSVLHLATNIQGTGFLFTNEIVKNGWKYTSLTEDRALTADCVVEGYEISYNDAAVFYDEQPVSLKVALRQRLRWSKGHLLAFAESGWGLFKNIFIDTNTIHKPTDKWYNYPWRTFRHRFMSYDTLAQLLPKNVITIFRWIVVNLILFPFVCFESGLYDNILKGSTYFCKALRLVCGDVYIDIAPGMKAYLTCLLFVIWVRITMRIGKYLSNIFVAVYLFIIERKRIKHVKWYKKILYCFTWPTFDIIGRYTQYVALFVKVTWKPIPHNSKITIDDIANE